MKRWSGVPRVVLALLALGALFAGCGGGNSSTPVAFSSAGWESVASDVNIGALRRSSPQVGDCSLSVERGNPETLKLNDCGEGRGGVITRGGRPRSPTCSKESDKIRCSARNGVSVTVWAPRIRSATTLLKATIEAVDGALPDDGLVWDMWPEPNLTEPKGSLTLAPPRHIDEAQVRPCAAGRTAAAMLGSLTISKRTARQVAGRGVHISMIEKPSAVRSFSMAVQGECRRGRAGVLRGAAIELPASRVEPFVVVIPDYYSAGHRRGRRALLRGLLLEPRLYPGEKHNQLPETMLAEPEDPEAGSGQVPLFSSAWSGG
jgi:hypothetical protein